MFGQAAEEPAHYGNRALLFVEMCCQSIKSPKFHYCCISIGLFVLYPGDVAVYRHRALLKFRTEGIFALLSYFYHPRMTEEAIVDQMKELKVKEGKQVMLNVFS